MCESVSVLLYSFICCNHVCLILNYMSCLYILDFNPLQVTSFTNIFSHSVGCLFIFIDGFLGCAKAFKFNQVKFLFLWPLETNAEKYWQTICQGVLPEFYSRSYGFRSYIQVFNPFGVYFVYGVRKRFNLNSFTSSSPSNTY